MKQSKNYIADIVSMLDRSPGRRLEVQAPRTEHVYYVPVTDELLPLEAEPPANTRIGSRLILNLQAKGMDDVRLAEMIYLGPL